MATETVSNLFEMLKEAWTQDRMERQFYAGTRFLDKVERTSKYSIGRQAQVPLELSLPGGDSSVPTSGSTSLNPADALHPDRADYTITQQWRQVAIEVAALNQADAVGMRSVVDAQDSTIQSNLLGMRKNINRQSVSNGDALIAGCLAGAADTTILLDPLKYGQDALVRGWIRRGMQVDIGTSANEVSTVADAIVQSVDFTNPAAPKFVINSSVTEGATDFVSVANARAGAVSNEISGLRTLVGSNSSIIGTLDPASISEWRPAKVDTTTTTVSLDLLLQLQMQVFQMTGAMPKYITTGIKQASNLYAQFQPQYRTNTDGGAAGNVEGFSWNGLDINIDPDIPDRELYLLDLPSFIVVTGGGFNKPTWASDIEGAGGRLRWQQGSTKFVDGLYYGLQLGLKRRNSNAAAIGLTA